MWISRKTHQQVVAGLQIQLQDLRQDNKLLREDNQKLLDKLLASLKPQAAATLHPRQILGTPMASPPGSEDEDYPEEQESPPPTDLEAWLRERGELLRKEQLGPEDKAS